jgi:molybdenum cofactor cytidylyltransferase
MTPRVGVVVLAAGRSARFGPPNRHKLLATAGGVPLVRLSVNAAVDAGVGDVVVVTGARGDEVRGALDGLPVRIVHEPAFVDGMAVSLRRGVIALERDVGAVMIGLGDQPGMRPDAYRAVASRWIASGLPIVVPRYAATSGPAHPTLFAAEVFSELLALDGDAGARRVVARDPSRVAEALLDWPPPMDIDTLEDLESLGQSITAAPLEDASPATRSSPPLNSSP